MLDLQSPQRLDHSAGNTAGISATPKAQTGRQHWAVTSPTRKLPPHWAGPSVPRALRRHGRGGGSGQSPPRQGLAGDGARVAPWNAQDVRSAGRSHPSPSPGEAPPPRLGGLAGRSSRSGDSGPALTMARLPSSSAPPLQLPAAAITPQLMGSRD